MLTQLQNDEIKEHLDSSQNPLFFFDNDPDGLCSFLLLQRFSGKGKGVPIKSFPSLHKKYFRKVNELNADYIFVLDKPLISEEFIEEARKENIPIIWIDHHEFSQKNIPDNVYYYNPLYNEHKTNEPVTDLCYKITNNKKDLWIAVVGCVYDKFLPDYYQQFRKEYPELTVSTNEAFKVLYGSEVGKIARIFNFSMMDKTTNVVSMLKYLMDAKNPYDVLNENVKNKQMHKRFNEIDGKYKKILEKVTFSSDFFNDVLFFTYGGETSMSGDIANEVSYLYPNKKVLIGYRNGFKINISGRGKNIREKIMPILKEIPGSSGGGHKDAIGASIPIDLVEFFKQKLEEMK